VETPTKTIRPTLLGDIGLELLTDSRRVGPPESGQRLHAVGWLLLASHLVGYLLKSTDVVAPEALCLLACDGPVPKVGPQDTGELLLTPHTST
jgi:hypothetical protein